jgi:hypothetical protein
MNMNFPKIPRGVIVKLQRAKGKEKVLKEAVAWGRGWEWGTLPIEE